MSIWLRAGSACIASGFLVRMIVIYNVRNENMTIKASSKLSKYVVLFQGGGVRKMKLCVFKWRCDGACIARALLVGLRYGVVVVYNVRNENTAIKASPKLS